MYPPDLQAKVFWKKDSLAWRQRLARRGVDISICGCWPHAWGRFYFDGTNNAWSSSEYSAGFAWNVYCNGHVDYTSKTGARWALPVQELS